MKILAIDSSGMTASVALLCDDVMVAEYSVQYKKTHSQTLVPMLEEIRRMSELDLKAVDYIAVAGGPGSFTGLRIGSATAKGLSLALDKPIVSVPTLEGMAMLALPFDGLIVPMLDARRSQVFAGIYERREERLQVVEDQAPVDVTELAERLHGYGRPAFLMGDGALVYRDILRAALQERAFFAPAHLNVQRAGALARRACDYIAAGRIQTGEEHAPQYLRVSQAERVRAEREQA